MVKVSVGTITLTRVIGPVVAKVEMSLGSSESLSYNSNILTMLFVTAYSMLSRLVRGPTLPVECVILFLLRDRVSQSG